MNFVLTPLSLLGSFICCSAVLELFSLFDKLQYRHCQMKCMLHYRLQLSSWVSDLTREQECLQTTQPSVVTPFCFKFSFLGLYQAIIGTLYETEILPAVIPARLRKPMLHHSCFSRESRWPEYPSAPQTLRGRCSRQIPCHDAFPGLKKGSQSVASRQVIHHDWVSKSYADPKQFSQLGNQRWGAVGPVLSSGADPCLLLRGRNL